MPTRERVRRHLDTLFEAMKLPLEPVEGAHAKSVASEPFSVPAEFNARQYAIVLLQVAASIEHALMVEYLYAGYSLNPDQPDPAKRAKVSEWKEIILGVAKEEMGHLVTIQNVLRCLGGPLSLDREDYPWDSDFYPFAFRLEPLSLESLAKYVYTESPGPEEFHGPLADEVKKLALGESGSRTVHRVAVLYELMQKLLSDRTFVPDADFHSETFPYQANWDEWGRSHNGAPKGSSKKVAQTSSNVLVLPVVARTDTVGALGKIATQGEANPTADPDAPSHFARFLGIFQDFPRDQSWVPSRPVAHNPIPASGIAAGHDGGIITHPEAILWAHLFNVRYRMLLMNLLHTFEFPNSTSERSELTPRGLLIHSTFGEMYNLRALSEILMQIPLSVGSKEFAGPPFEMPYTLQLPVDQVSRWNVHLDLVEVSAGLIRQLRSINGQRYSAYLCALEEADMQLSASIEAIGAGGKQRTVYSRGSNARSVS